MINVEWSTKYFIEGDTINSYYSSIDNQGWETSSNLNQMSDKKILETFTDEFLQGYKGTNKADIYNVVKQLRRDHNINEIIK